MKKVIFRHSTSRQLLLSVAFLFTFTLSGFSQAQATQDTTAQAEAGQEEAASGTDAGASSLGDPAAGKELFNSLCAACHKPYSNSIGPALHGVTDRRDMDWIHEWIKNSAALIASGDAEANAIYEEWNQTAMPAFPQLSDGDIDNILAYVEQPKPEPQAAAGAAGGEAGATGGSGGVSTDVILGILVFVLAMIL